MQVLLQYGYGKVRNLRAGARSQQFDFLLQLGGHDHIPYVLPRRPGQNDASQSPQTVHKNVILHQSQRIGEDLNEVRVAEDQKFKMKNRCIPDQLAEHKDANALIVEIGVELRPLDDLV